MSTSPPEPSAEVRASHSVVLDAARHHPGGRRVAAALVGLTMATLASLGSAPLARADMTPELAARVVALTPGQTVPVVATLTDQVSSHAYEGRPQARELALRRTAARTQPTVADDVTARVRRFWLVNAVALQATADDTRRLAADPAVASVALDPSVRLMDDPTPVVEPLITSYPDPGQGTWGVSAVNAPAVWRDYGIQGAGVLMGSIDTGVDATHPDLAGKVGAFRDFVNGRTTPYDDSGHGTHTIGIMVGGASKGVPIGVAPGARVVVAKAIAASGAAPGSNLLAAAQWMTDPDGDPATADYPQVINNSWSATDPNDPWFHAIIKVWVALGIVPVFAAGNSGPTAGTVGSPPAYPEAIAVGATDQTGQVASFSARGLVVWQNLDGSGPAAGTVLVKPDVVAPGVTILSTVGGGYLAYSGTSMAAPHVAGVAALLKQANPTLGAADIAQILRQTATDIGPAGADPAAGAGSVNALAAVGAALGPAPDTRLVAAPPAVVTLNALTYQVRVSGGDSVRARIDGGAWTPPTTSMTVTLTVGEGRHVIEVQGLAASGAVDPTPARNKVTVDLTAPTVGFTARARGGSATLVARASDRLSAVDPGSYLWRFDDGTRASGARATHAFADNRPHRVTLTVRDRAGNHGRASRRVTAPAPTPVGSVTARVRRTSHRGASLVVHGRSRRPAVRVCAVLVPAGHVRVSQSRETRVTAEAGSIAGRFSLVVSLRRLPPGAYILRLSGITRGGSTFGHSLTRTVRVR